MDILKGFLERFKHLKDPREQKERLALVLSELLKTEISYKQIELKSNSLSILGISPIIRSQIYIQKQYLLEQLRLKCPTDNIADIK